MDKIDKFLASLRSNERKHLVEVIFPKIRDLDLKGLNVKKLSGYDLWRVKWKDIRVLFVKTNTKGIIMTLGTRQGIYKKIN
jgi:predicted N-acyltransferase